MTNKGWQANLELDEYKEAIETKIDRIMLMGEYKNAKNIFPETNFVL